MIPLDASADHAHLRPSIGEEQMRAVLVAGMMMAAGAAGAADFGVNFETAHSKITKVISPGIQFQGCKARDCHYFDAKSDIDVFVGLEANGAVSSFSVLFLPHSWAMAANLAAKVQTELLVPTAEVVSLERAAQRAADGHEDLAFSAYVHCMTQSKNNELGIHCRRK